MDESDLIGCVGKFLSTSTGRIKKIEKLDEEYYKYVITYDLYGCESTTYYSENELDNLLYEIEECKNAIFSEPKIGYYYDDTYHGAIHHITKINRDKVYSKDIETAEAPAWNEWYRFEKSKLITENDTLEFEDSSLESRYVGTDALNINSGYKTLIIKIERVKNTLHLDCKINNNCSIHRVTHLSSDGVHISYMRDCDFFIRI